MKLIIANCLLLIIFTGCVSKPALVNIGNNTNAELQKRIDEYKAKLDFMSTQLGKQSEEYKKLKEETMQFMEVKGSAKSLDLRVWEVIKIVVKFICSVLWACICTWGGDIIWLGILISLFTWISGFLTKLLPAFTGIWGMVIKALTFWMNFEKNMKILTSIIWAFILSVVWKLTHSPCDWSYAWVIAGFACIVANIFWEYIINKTGVSDKVSVAAHSVLAKKINLKG